MRAGHRSAMLQGDRLLPLRRTVAMVAPTLVASFSWVT
jgi:hypothetical protein